MCCLHNVFSKSSLLIGFILCHPPVIVFNFRTKKLGMILKMLVLLSLPGPLFLWPIVGILGSFLGGIGFGFFAPLLATFEAVGANVPDKFYHCFVVRFISSVQVLMFPVYNNPNICNHLCQIYSVGSNASYLKQKAKKILDVAGHLNIKISLSRRLKVLVIVSAVWYTKI